MIELQGISAGQLATVLTAYTPQTEHTANTAAIGVNAAAIAALQGQVAALPAAPDLTPLAADLAAWPTLPAWNTSLTQGLAAKANQSALDALQVEVDSKSTPASVDLKLANHPTTAAMTSSITSANNATLATVAATYALKSVVDQLSLDVAARQTAADVDQRVATALLPMASTSDLNAAMALRTTPADVSQLIATALLPFVQQTALDAALALRDGRLDAAEALLAALQAAGYQTSGDLATALLGYVTQATYDAGQALQDSRLDAADVAILALQNAGPFATSGDLTSLQVSLQSAIDGLLAEIATLGGATNLVNAPAWQGEITWDLIAGTNQVRNLHAVAPLSIQLANDDWTLSFACDAYSRAEADALLLPKASEAWVLATLGGYSTTQETADAIAAALTNYFTQAEVTFNLVAAVTESKDYTDAQLADYSDTAAMNQAIADALVPYGTIVQRDAAIGADGQRHRCGARHHRSQPLLDHPPGAGSNHGRTGTRHIEQRPVLDRRAHRNPFEGHERPAQFVRGGCAHRHPPEPGRHDPHRVGQLRPQRNLHPAGDGSRHHGGPRCAQFVPVPDGGPGAGAHRRRAGAVLGPERGVELRGRRVEQLRDKCLCELQHHALSSYDNSSQVDNKIMHGPLGLLHLQEIADAIAGLVGVTCARRSSRPRS